MEGFSCYSSHLVEPLNLIVLYVPESTPLTQFSWLLPQSKIVKAVLLETSKDVSWFSLQPNSVKAVAPETSKGVSWLSAHHNSVKAVLLDTSKDGSWLLAHHK